MNGKNQNNNFDKKMSEIAYFIIGVLDIVFEVGTEFLKAIGEFIFKKYPKLSFFSIVGCLVLVTTVSFASNITQSNKYNELKSESERREEELTDALKSTNIKKEEPGWTKIYSSYKLSSGDTLLGLAYTYTNGQESPSEWMRNVMEMNDISNENLIQSGQVIEIYTYEYLTADLSK